MKINFSKFSKLSKNSKNSNINSSKDTNDIDFTGTIIHVGRVLTINDINKNRSSKYKYLSF